MNEDDIFSYSVLFSFLTLEEKILRTESDNLDLEHEMSKILIPNNEDMFYCTRSNCCSIEKDFKNTQDRSM